MRLIIGRVKKVKLLRKPYWVLILLMCGTASWAQKKGKVLPELALTKVGLLLEVKYTKEIKKLKLQILSALPKIDAIHKTAFLKALEDERKAKDRLDAAKKNLAKINAAKGLVGHAKGKWIGGANKGIAKAKDQLKKATTSEQKKKATKELLKWQKNLEDGKEALAQRQALLDKAKAQEPEMKKEYTAAQQALSTTQLYC